VNFHDSTPLPPAQLLSFNWQLAFLKSKNLVIIRQGKKHCPHRLTQGLIGDLMPPYHFSVVVKCNVMLKEKGIMRRSACMRHWLGIGPIPVKTYIGGHYSI